MRYAMVHLPNCTKIYDQQTLSGATNYSLSSMFDSCQQVITRCKMYSINTVIITYVYTVCGLTYDVQYNRTQDTGEYLITTAT